MDLKNKNISFNGNQLKLIAMFCMFIDHFYKFGIIPENIIFKIIGRIAFPIFVYCVAEGAYHTKHRARYLLTMFLFAVLSEIPFDLMAYNRFIYMGHQNVMWTFFLGLLAVFLADCAVEKLGPNNRNRIIWHYMFATLFGMAALIYGTDYHFVGVFCIVQIYLFKVFSTGEKKFKYHTLLYLAGANMILAIEDTTQLFGLLALIPIWFYNGERGSKKTIWKFFYLVYPLHMLLIYLARRFLL